MPSWKRYFFRLLIILLLAGLQLLYFPVNRSASGGVAPALPVDAWIPLQPVWVFPYLAVLPAWAIALVWSSFKMDERMFQVSVITTLTAAGAGMAMFYFFPTYVIRPEVQGTGLASDIVRWVYSHDQPYNALPSSHVYLTVIIALLWSRWKPKGTVLWLALAVIVCLSTLFTKQHYLLDVISGLGLAVIAFVLGIGITTWLEKRLNRAAY